MTIGMGDLEEGDRVLLEFVSSFNPDAGQTLVGTVTKDHGEAEVHVGGDDGEVYIFQWEGLVLRSNPDGPPKTYGQEATMSRLERVNPSLDDA